MSNRATRKPYHCCCCSASFTTAKAKFRHLERCKEHKAARMPPAESREAEPASFKVEVSIHV